MKKQIITILSLALTLCLCLGIVSVCAQGDAGTGKVDTGPADILSDTWAGTDELGRVFPDNAEAGDPRNGKYVGIFYFLFMSHEATTIYDTTQTYLDGGVEAVWEMAPLDGFHTWGRPYFGYYRTDLDEWIYRKHAQLLTDAGIDFVFLDTTNNGGLFENCWKLLLKTWRKVRDEGGNTPQIVFHNGDEEDTLANHIKTIYKDAYSKPEYADLWFMWEGKPLILGNLNKSKVSTELQEYFTFRRSWAFNSFTGDGILKWPWIAEYPQEPGRNAAGEVEQIVVSAGFHSNSSRGRSFHDGKQPSRGVGDFGYGLDTIGDGLAFQEQWNRVFELDPPLVMITGWNEFTIVGDLTRRINYVGISQPDSDTTTAPCTRKAIDTVVLPKSVSTSSTEMVCAVVLMHTANKGSRLNNIFFMLSINTLYSLYSILYHGLSSDTE